MAESLKADLVIADLFPMMSVVRIGSGSPKKITSLLDLEDREVSKDRKNRKEIRRAITMLSASIIEASIINRQSAEIGRGHTATRRHRRLAMSNVIPEKYADLFQKPAFASLGTLMPDGRPQVTPVWCDFDGQYVIFNSARGRQKDKNVRRDPRVALSVIDPDNPYRYLEIRGTVVEITEEGAAENINKLAKKYLGVDKYPYAKPGEVRVMYKIRPEHTTVMG